MQKLFLGVDAGATHTRAAICNEKGMLVGLGVGGSGHYSCVGIKGVLKSIQEALTHAGFRSCYFKGACIALASLWVAVDYSPHYSLIKRLIEAKIKADRVLLVNDAYAALWGAFSGQPGIVCVAGTGSVGLARTDSGKVMRIGGWGHLLGDEGSAYRISLEAIQAALKAYDGTGESTSLLDRACSFFYWKQPEEAIRSFYEGPLNKREVARFAQIVITEAKNGDPVAMRIVKSNISFLAHCVKVIAESARIYRVAPVGGVFRDYYTRELFAQEIAAANISCVTPDMPPVLGAVGLIMETTGAITPKTTAQQLKLNVAKVECILSNTQDPIRLGRPDPGKDKV